MPPSPDRGERRVRIHLGKKTSEQVAHLQTFRRESGLEKEAASLEKIVEDAIDLLHQDTFD
jgi:hypothetical protein